MLDQDHWINSLKSGCNFCHQLGNALTRDVKHVFAAQPELRRPMRKHGNGAWASAFAEPTCTGR